MEDLSRPSGVTIPLFLKRRWEKQQQEQRPQDPALVRDNSENQNPEAKDDDTTNNTSIGENEKAQTVIWEPQLRLSPDQELTRDEKKELSNRVFTTSELEERIWKTSVAMFDIQKQLYRGEEIYFEDTYSHGSVYKGWDAFVDTASATGGGGTQTNSNRRVPVDSRWFSSSCGSLSRTKPPAPFPPPLVSQSVLSMAKLPSIPEQQQDGTSVAAAPQPLPATVASTESIAEKVQSSSSARIRQRTAASAVTTSSFGTRSAEKGDSGGNSSTPKANSRPTTPIGSGRNVDIGSIRKKRKTVAAVTTSEEPPSKKANQKSSIDETKRLKTGSATKTAVTVAGTTKGLKSDRDVTTTKGESKNFMSEKKEGAPSLGTKSNKAEISTLANREKEIETPVPRKRGRPRRKT